MNKILEGVVIAGVGGCVIRFTYILGRERGFRRGIKTGKELERLDMLNNKIKEYLNKKSKEETES